MTLKIKNKLSKPIGYEAPHVDVMECSIEGVLCGSRQIDDLEVLPELDW